MKVISLLKKLKFISSSQVRQFSSEAKVKVKLIEEVEKLIHEETIKARKHPGIIKNGTVELPSWIVEAMDQCLEDVDRPTLYKQREKFDNYLFSRRLPIEEHEIEKKVEDIETQYLGNTENLSEDDILEKKKSVRSAVKKNLLTKVFAWKPIEYNNYRSLLHMITRSTAEYAVLQTIFNEIQTRDPEFNPETIFDFGSGVGTVLWASRERWKNINEYLAVDISNHMNDLSEKIIGLSPSKFDKAFYRQYLPVTNLRYDLVVSAYSLMELHDVKSRLATIAKLWKKTNKYLVIVEQGTNAGFQLVNEAREFVKYVMENIETDSDYYTFAPCPHDLTCPRLKLEKKTPCNFISSSYKTLPFLGPSKPRNELYSYVILKKGKRSETDNWYRIVRPTLPRSRHLICRMCNSDGNLQEIIFTAHRHGKALYKCATASKWGDRLPIEAISKIDATEQVLSSKIEGGAQELNSQPNIEINEEEKENELSCQELYIKNETEAKIEDKKILISKAPIFFNKNDDL